ncbi:MAG: hypothetical protein LBD12_03405 [Clostridiales Family XIII bacterium]|nr:hypothetical protein [Clostridiales Family XIII bacterium]
MENMSIASTPPVSWVDKGVQPGKKYYYRIVPFKVEKTSTGLYSSVLCGKPSAAKSVTTRATSIVDSTMEYFRDNWGKTVNIDTTRAVQYKVMKGSGGVCDLQIHIYLEYMGDRTEIRDKRQMFIDGVTAAWGGVEVSDPSPLDFPYEGEVRFRTSVHLHERSEDDTRGQQYVQVHMGGLCPNASDEEEWVSHWYHAHSVILGWETDIIYLPTDRWVEGNPDQDFDEPSRERSYHATSGHEMGHILGLHDANRMRGIEGLAGSRLDASDETTVLHDIQRHDNIMSLPRTIPHALPNDVEMALYAYNHNGQAYRTHVYGTGNSAIRFARSDRVRSETRDLYPDELHS